VHFSLAEKLCEDTALVNVIEILCESLGLIRSNYKVPLCIHAD